MACFSWRTARQRCAPPSTPRPAPRRPWPIRPNSPPRCVGCRRIILARSTWICARWWPRGRSDRWAGTPRLPGRWLPKRRGSAPGGGGRAPGARAAFARGSEASSLADWMPAGTRAEMILFGLQQTIAALEEQITDSPAMQDAADALNQLRALAAIGLGINVDRDLLSLFDREVGIVVNGEDGQATVQLLLRPRDMAAASAPPD